MILLAAVFIGFQTADALITGKFMKDQTIGLRL